jgi:hypothetical protein
MQDDTSTNLRRREFGKIHTTKKPRKMPGHGSDWFFLAKNKRPLQLGRAAWLTAMLLPITVAGPRPIRTALPHFPSLQFVDSV